MYAININNAPYIVPKENVQNFLETSEKQKGVAEKLGTIFGKECFEFKEDENGYMVANIDVQRKVMSET